MPEQCYQVTVDKCSWSGGTSTYYCHPSFLNNMSSINYCPMHSIAIPKYDIGGFFGPCLPPTIVNKQVQMCFQTNLECYQYTKF